MRNTNLIKWETSAWALPEPARPDQPIAVICGEAVDVAAFVGRRYLAKRSPEGDVAFPGLEQVARENIIYPELGAEIRELQEALSAAQAELRFQVVPAQSSPVERAQTVVSEIHAALAYLLDDGVEDDADLRLAAVAEAHARAESQDALASALDEYAALAELERERLVGFGDFDPALIGEAKVLSVALRAHSANKLAAGDTTTRPISLRNRIAALLDERVARVRSAARYVFRKHPVVLREATSAYERKKRSKNARKKRSAATDGTG